METVIAKLREAKRPLILAGHGIRAAHEVTAFRKAVKVWGIPVVTTQLARDLLAYNDPLYIGTPGVKGDRAGGMAIQNCDVLLVLGCSLHPTTTGYERHLFAPQAFKIQVDLDLAVLKKNTDIIQYAVSNSVNHFLTSLSDSSFTVPSWHKQCSKWKFLFDLKTADRIMDEKEISYYDVIDAICELAPRNATIIADAGSAFYITGQAFRAKEKQRVILPGGLAQMGYTTSAMIGACFADPDCMVIGLVGDGSIQTNIHDLGVIAYHKLNAKIFLLNNHGYSCIRNTQSRYFKGPYSGIDERSGVSFPSFSKLAMAYSLQYRMCLSPARLLDRTKDVLYGFHGPVLFEVITKKDQEIQPCVQSEVMTDGSMKSHGLDHMWPYSTS